MICLNILCFFGIGITVAFGQIFEIQVQQRSLYPAIASQNYTLVCNILPQKIANDSSVVWRFSNGSTVPENEEFHSEGHYRQFLVIRNVKQSYTGLKLVCVTRDRDRSTVESKNYTLTVIAGPEIQFAEETIYSQSGKPFHKECRAMGFPYPVVRWYQEAGQEASQITLADHHSMLFVNEVGPELRFTCHATVTHGSLQLTIYKTFTLKSYDVENSKVDDFFLNDTDYKYTMFLLNLLDFCLMILALAIAAILWKWWGNGKRLKEHIKQNSIKLEELKPEKEAKLIKASRAMKRSKKECQNSLMNMKNSYKIIPKAICKKQKYRFNDAKRKTLTAPPTLDPQEYSGLKERTSGPNVYDDMNGPTTKNMSTFESADSRLKSSNSSSYLEILADVDKQQTDSVIYSEVKRETAAERDIISEEN
ncbi:uncharacterized protein LOC128156301 isoform X3 [Crassostrea angulata]|uniref:uncharacterized protein LOC128156301 isoform X3 n=1 Tax=Magallana angulata TaxID=2784310 RepID=UPI0022B1F392|nr:uncharacterized protein LOC128156301 isoform X3 [Crassostrea angulata]